MAPDALTISPRQNSRYAYGQIPATACALSMLRAHSRKDALRYTPSSSHQADALSLRLVTPF
jgi:hypothetical protein